MLSQLLGLAEARRSTAKESMFTIAIDLDETLLCVTKEPLLAPAQAICSHGYIYLRPYASDFLKSISKSNRVGIWSSAPSEYVTSVLSESTLQDVDFKFLWTARDCSFNDYGTGTIFYYKDTNSLRQAFNSDLVLLIDDSPVKIVSHGSDAIAIESFSGDDNDDELLHVWHFVEAIQNADRKVTFDKFGWRNVKR